MLLQMSRARADEEEYWHSSKFRAFTFDDEDDELSQVGAEPPPRPAPPRAVGPRPHVGVCANCLLPAAEGIEAGGEQPSGHR